jgi:serine phosphatase RsbU (regulator of sigma subunit)
MYAKRIQTTILAHKEFIDDHISKNFIFFKPKDIVSGDFYWATKRNNLFYLAVCDSTGHGVPGAFMSLLSISFLNEAIGEKNITKPNEVFNYVRQKLIENISKEGQKDGFDGVLLCMNQDTKEITYAAANNRPVIVSAENKLMELASDRMPVGYGERKEDFTLHSIQLQKNDTLYLFTDGYADQFGGPKGKKLMYKKLHEFLINIVDQPFETQTDALNTNFDSWKGNLEQVDDVCVIGLRVA